MDSDVARLRGMDMKILGQVGNIIAPFVTAQISY